MLQPRLVVAFTINHIAAVVLPVGLGFVWLWSPALVFLSGAAMAGISLYLALWVPHDACPGDEWHRPRLVKPQLTS